jgi:predicted metalloprotease with PDZ domain
MKNVEQRIWIIRSSLVGEVFQVVLNKTAQGLGISIMSSNDLDDCGRDKSATDGCIGKDELSQTRTGASPYSCSSAKKSKGGYIRIKKIYPTTPASECGNLLPGDILLAANGVELTGLTSSVCTSSEFDLPHCSCHYST